MAAWDRIQHLAVVDDRLRLLEFATLDFVVWEPLLQSVGEELGRDGVWLRDYTHTDIMVGHGNHLQ